MSDAELHGLSKEIVDWYIRWNPSFATHAGIHQDDHLMPRATYEAELEERSHVKAFLRRLEESTARRCLTRSGSLPMKYMREIFARKTKELRRLRDAAV